MVFHHDGIDFRWLQNGAGLPFVFQHGLGASLDQPFGLFDPPAGVRLIGFDCRAHGETRPVGDPAKIAIAAFADDLLALLDYLQIKRAVIGGISMGAALALEFALRFPAKTAGLVLCRPAWLDEPRRDNKKYFQRVAEHIRRHGAKRGGELFRETAEYRELLQQSPDNAASLVRQFDAPRAEETVVKLERIPEYAPQFTRSDWARLRIPTLVLANREDTIHPFEFGETFARSIPGAFLKEIPPKSLNPEKHREDLQAAVAEFLRQSCGARSEASAKDETNSQNQNSNAQNGQ